VKINKLFIANRAEIACRIAATARKMGIATCGVYTPQDGHCKHTRVLDELILLPAGPLAANYLNQELIIESAQRLGADAVHPGYGFLAENPDFAERVLKSGLIWVGPKPDAMRKLGGKIEAKQVAAAVGVPVTPWQKISEAETDPEQTAMEIGLPLLIKAAHGGGGRGQRVVNVVSQFSEALRTARSEAQRSFGSSEVFVEKFLERPRHIEVQVIGDEHGHVFALGERDCSAQRRNQKVIEETPAAELDESTRQKIIRSALSLASAVGYCNAGTIEFLAQKATDGSWEYYFMELNARLQVEHPVTEMVWGVDLVELQLRIAQGEVITELPVTPSGHAIELRLCAENPANNFLPTPGPITEFSVPRSDGVRLDAGFEMGDVIPQEYDSLFAKLIIKADDRAQAIQNLTAVLENSMIAGVITNKYFLQRVLEHPDFLQNRINTRWIESHRELVAEHPEILDRDLIYWAKKISSELFVQRRPSRVFNANQSEILIDFSREEGVHGEPSPQGLIQVAGYFKTAVNMEIYASGWINRHEICLSFQRPVAGIGQRRLVFAGQYDVEDVRAHHGPIVAQVPGVVLDIRAKVDDVVEAQSPILVIEAMKIEMPMSLPVTAKITSINVKRGDRIQPGQTLVTWEPAA
jgi:acetyl/propionyl-CoA carboxylase alpha subunit